MKNLPVVSFLAQSVITGTYVYDCCYTSQPTIRLLLVTGCLLILSLVQIIELYLLFCSSKHGNRLPSA
ncbi:MAG: hypothetical protein EBV06_12805 [Planctomycetia bacterium]|nr:hypothetical protein [Planctomycetia bacterium]